MAKRLALKKGGGDGKRENGEGRAQEEDAKRARTGDE